MGQSRIDKMLNRIEGKGAQINGSVPPDLLMRMLRILRCGVGRSFLIAWGEGGAALTLTVAFACCVDSDADADASGPRIFLLVQSSYAPTRAYVVLSKIVR